MKTKQKTYRFFNQNSKMNLNRVLHGSEVDMITEKSNGQNKTFENVKVLRIR